MGAENGVGRSHVAVQSAWTSIRRAAARGTAVTDQLRQPPLERRAPRPTSHQTWTPDPRRLDKTSHRFGRSPRQTMLGGRQDLPLGTCDISVLWGRAVARPTGQASVARKDVKAEAVELQACWLGGARNRCRVRRWRPRVRRGGGFGSWPEASHTEIALRPPVLCTGCGRPY